MSDLVGLLFLPINYRRLGSFTYWAYSRWLDNNRVLAHSTEMGSLIARDSAALPPARSPCLPSPPEDAPVGDWGEVLRELPERVGNRVNTCRNRASAGQTDLARIGPALKFSAATPMLKPPPAMKLNSMSIWKVGGSPHCLEQVLGTAEARPISAPAPWRRMPG